MTRYTVRRAMALVPVLLGISLVLFLVMRVVPGDVALVIGGDAATEDDLRQIRAQLGLNDPVWLQYVRFLGGVVRGDLGTSLVSRRPVAEEVGARVGATLELALAGIAIAIAVGVTAGVTAGIRPNTLGDDLVTGMALFGVSMPPYWLGMMLVLVFSLMLGWLPTSGRGGLAHLILPAVTLGLYSSALIARMTRSSLVEVLGEDFLRTARAKGLPESRVILLHALKNSMIPTVAVTGLQFGNMLGRSVIAESIFAWPGLGQLMLYAITTRDIPLLQGAVFFTATSFVLINLLVDISYGFLDPRIRYR
ncbi:MAG: ABC transporter permease [Armatimonadetes bacterium]|nr:ABC transporter permease [Armatimonadota bacterium]